MVTVVPPPVPPRCGDTDAMVGVWSFLYVHLLTASAEASLVKDTVIAHSNVALSSVIDNKLNIINAYRQENTSYVTTKYIPYVYL